MSKWDIEPLQTTSHFNVVRVRNIATGQTVVAKGIFHIEGDNNLGPAQSDRAFEIETAILAKLPSWWGIRLLDAFHAGDVRIVVTPELPTHPWRLYISSVDSDRKVAAALEQQLRWLHSQHIVHRDLELKNVLLTEDGPVIIDFEKARMEATSAEVREDWEKLVGSLRERENTRRIGDFLATRAPVGRRHSIGGKRRSRRMAGRGRSRKLNQITHHCSYIHTVVHG